MYCQRGKRTNTRSNGFCTAGIRGASAKDVARNVPEVQESEHAIASSAFTSHFKSVMADVKALVASEEGNPPKHTESLLGELRDVATIAAEDLDHWAFYEASEAIRVVDKLGYSVDLWPVVRALGQNSREFKIDEFEVFDQYIFKLMGSSGILEALRGQDGACFRKVILPLLEHKYCQERFEPVVDSFVRPLLREHKHTAVIEFSRSLQALATRLEERRARIANGTPDGTDGSDDSDYAGSDYAGSDYAGSDYDGSDYDGSDSKTGYSIRKLSKWYGFESVFALEFVLRDSSWEEIGEFITRLRARYPPADLDLSALFGFMYREARTRKLYGNYVDAPGKADILAWKMAAVFWQAKRKRLLELAFLGLSEVLYKPCHPNGKPTAPKRALSELEGDMGAAFLDDPTNPKL